MLQRAASNAYSWWWASHIRTKQSKWLEQSLQDMEEKVANAMNLVQKDGDSFAKRAEMYYRHRPELIAFIEESVRAYRALAERYDKLSTDLQKANTTIASVFPDQLPYDTDYDDNDNGNDNDESDSGPRNIGPDPPKAPKVPETMKTLLTYSPNKHLIKNATKEDNGNRSKGAPKSGLTKEEAVDEIDKLQKDILSMQTVKEFTKSSYESRLVKFSEIENKIIEMQQRVCDLQDEFKVVKDIEDDDARVIMAEAALKSCQENLAKLQAKHDESSHKARLERERIHNVKQKLESFKHEYLQCSDDDHHHHNLDHDEHESEHNELQEKIEETIKELSKKRLTVTEMADMIDKLVNTVIGLETLVSSQSALIERLRTETDDLHVKIQNLEQDKGVKTYKDVEKKLDGVQDLGINIENQNNKLSLHFTEAHCNVHLLFDKIYHHVKPDEERANDDVANNTGTTYNKQTSLSSKIPLTEELLVQSREHTNIGKHVKRDEDLTNDDVANKMITLETTYDKQNSIPNRIPLIAEVLVVTREVGMETNISTKPEDRKPASKDLETTFDVLKASEPQVETNWQELLLGGLDDKQKLILQEYTTILRKYKTAKKELVEEEQKNQKRVGEMKLLLAKQDYEIEQMKQKLNLLQEIDQEQVVYNEADIKPIFIDSPDPVSETEAKLRADIDAILDENLDFWLRFSSTFHQVQKFKTEVEDLQKEIIKVKAKGSDGKTNIRSEMNAIFKHLKETQTELAIWLDQSAILKNELQRRFESLFDIQGDIERALREGFEEDEIKFNTHQAAKFQGEVSNMQQENTKVNQELEAGLSHVTALQVETEETLKRLEDEFGLSDQKQPRSPNRPHVPLRSFIFGTKSKKQKPSILACINPHKKLTASSFL